MIRIEPIYQEGIERGLEKRQIQEKKRNVEWPSMLVANAETQVQDDAT